MRAGRTETETARWLIGADGARSETRAALGIEFEGFTWPERFLAVSTPFDFHGATKDLVCVNYVADPQRWHFLLQIPGVWRVMFPIAANARDDLPQRACVPDRRCRAHQRPARRHGNDRRHSRSDHPDGSPRRGVARHERRRRARSLRSAAPAGAEGGCR